MQMPLAPATKNTAVLAVFCITYQCKRISMTTIVLPVLRPYQNAMQPRLFDWVWGSPDLRLPEPETLRTPAPAVFDRSWLRFPRTKPIFSTAIRRLAGKDLKLITPGAGRYGVAGSVANSEDASDT